MSPVGLPPPRSHSFNPAGGSSYPVSPRSRNASAIKRSGEQVPSVRLVPGVAISLRADRKSGPVELVPRDRKATCRGAGTSGDRNVGCRRDAVNQVMDGLRRSADIWAGKGTGYWRRPQAADPIFLPKPLTSGMAGTADQDGEKRMPSEHQQSHEGERRAAALPARFGRLAPCLWFPGVGPAAKTRGEATIVGARLGNRMQTDVVRFRTY